MKGTRKIVGYMTAPVHFIAHFAHDRMHIHLPKVITNHIKPRHVRVTAGGGIMYIGVTVAKLSHHFHGPLEIIVDAAGYTIHAIGAIPLVVIAGSVLKLEESKHE